MEILIKLNKQNMIKVLRSNSDSPDFIALVRELIVIKKNKSSATAFIPGCKVGVYAFSSSPILNFFIFV